MRPRPFLEPGSPHPTCLPSSPFLPMTPPSKPWVSGKGALEGGTTDPQGVPSSSQWSGTCSIRQGAGPPPGGRSSQRDPAPSTTWFWRPIPPPAQPLWNPLSLHGSEAGPAAPPKGSFLSHLPWPRGVRSDSSPAPHGASFKLTPQGPPPPPSCPPPPPPLPWTGFSRPPPLFSAVNTDHSHCMRTPTHSAFRVPFRRQRPTRGSSHQPGACCCYKNHPDFVATTHPGGSVSVCQTSGPGLARQQPRRPQSTSSWRFPGRIRVLFPQVGVWLAG